MISTPVQNPFVNLAPYREQVYPTVQVRVILPFMLSGKRVEPGAEVRLLQPTADDLASRGRVELLT